MLVQYNPFSFGRWGVAPRLIWKMHAWQVRGAVTGLVLHERYVAMRTPKEMLMGGWQRLQLEALVARSDVCFRTEVEPTELRRLTNAPLLPVGSNLPDRRAARQDRRTVLELAQDRVVLATFGQRHPGRLIEHVRIACRDVASVVGPVVLLNLGAKAPDLGLIKDVDIVTPGPLSPDVLASYLAAADIVLLPYADGISTRRTTVMAALQHARAIVGVAGRLTNPAVWDGAVALAPRDNVLAFSGEAVRLATDEVARDRLGSRGRELYLNRFDWPVIARGMLDGLGVHDNAGGTQDPTSHAGR
jgi:glycosyltransferase involved in cell wall biosynthesis